MTHNRNKAMTYWTLAITSIALFMVSLDNLVVTTALPVIRRDLHATISQLEWTVNAYTLTFAVLLLTGAALGDRFGRRRMFVLGLSLFTARRRSLRSRARRTCSTLRGRFRALAVRS
jgi:MFS family permease